MEVKEITLSQLIAGSLIKFDRVDKYDLSILAQGLRSTDQTILLVPEISKEINKITRTRKNVTSLKGKFSELDSTNDFLNSIQGEVVKGYLDNLDMELFTLRKINYFGEIPAISIGNNLNHLQIEAFVEVIKKGQVDVCWNEDAIYEDYEVFFVTGKGLVRIFLDDNKDAVESFKKELIALNYDESLLDDFLLTQDLGKHYDEVLTVYNFKKFCSEYDRCLRKI